MFLPKPHAFIACIFVAFAMPQSSEFSLGIFLSTFLQYGGSSVLGLGFKEGLCYI